MRFGVRDALWRWRKWTENKTDKILDFNITVITWVSCTSAALLALWWLPRELASRRCAYNAGSDSELMPCLQERIDLYNTMFSYLVAVGGSLACYLAVYWLRRTVVGKYARPRYWRFISWWVSLTCATCLAGVVVQITAWIAFLAN